MSDIVGYNFPTAIRFGVGARRQLPDALGAAGVERVLVVTDRGVAALPWFEPLVEWVRSTAQAVAVFDGVWGNPVVSQVDAGVEAGRAVEADAIVAVGGGAALDVAKAIALMLNHPGHLFDYEDGKPDARPVDQPIPYLIALPTTAGTGSEVGRSAVVSDDTTHAKKIIFDPKLLPRLVLADPELTLGLPPHLTAATGMDALTHLVEAFLAKGKHPMADGIALEGLRLVAEHLEDAVRFAGDPEADREAHLAARAGMLDASLMGAVAFQKGLGVTHSCAHALSTVCDLHHGLANALMMPACMRFNLETVPDRFERLAATVGAPGGPGFVAWIERLRGAVGLPPSLIAQGVPRDALDRLVEVALADGCHPNNPRAVGADDLRALFLEAFDA